MFEAEDAEDVRKERASHWAFSFHWHLALGR